MRASELKVGQDFKFDGQRKFRCITEIKEIKSLDRARQEHIGKLLVFFDDGSQHLFSKEDNDKIEKIDVPVKTVLKNEPSRSDFEQYLNYHYSKSMNYETALKNFIYLTNMSIFKEKVIPLAKLKTEVRTKQFGRLIRKYDPLRFTAEYEAAKIK